MKITIESTDMITTMEGVPVRVWRGVTDKGVACDVFVRGMRVLSDADCSQFEDELKEIPLPAESRFVGIREIW